jgi:hypothetical protein
MILFWNKTGPLMKCTNGLLQIEDLNPQIATHWRMTRYEMFMTGLRFIVAAVRG